MTISEITNKYILEEFVRADGSINAQGELFIPVPRCSPNIPGDRKKTRFEKKNGVLVEEVKTHRNGHELLSMKRAPELDVLTDFATTFGAFRFVYESKKALYVELWSDGAFKTLKTANMPSFRRMQNCLGDVVRNMPVFAQVRDRAVAADDLPVRTFSLGRYCVTPSWPFCDDMSWAISDWWKYGLLPEGEHLVYKSAQQTWMHCSDSALLLWHMDYVPVHYEPAGAALKDPGALMAKLGAKMPVVAAVRLGEYAEKTTLRTMLDNPDWELFIVKAVPSQTVHAFKSSDWKLVRHKDKCLHRDGKFKEAMNKLNGQPEGTDK